MGRSVAGFDWALEQIGQQLTLWQIAGDAYSGRQKLAGRFPPVRLPLNATVIDAQNFWISDWTSFQSDVRPIGSRLFATWDGGKSRAQASPPAPCDNDPLALCGRERNGNLDGLWFSGRGRQRHQRGFLLGGWWGTE